MGFSPGFEIAERKINATVFRGACLQRSCGAEMYKASAETKIKRLAFADEGCRPHSHKRLLRRGRPCSYRPPAIQFANLIKIGPGYHYGASATGARYGVGKRDCEATPSKRGRDSLQRIWWQCLAVSCNDHNIRSVVAKLFTQLGLNIDK